MRLCRRRVCRLPVQVYVFPCRSKVISGGLRCPVEESRAGCPYGCSLGSLRLQGGRASATAGWCATSASIASAAARRVPQSAAAQREVSSTSTTSSCFYYSREKILPRPLRLLSDRRSGLPAATQAPMSAVSSVAACACEQYSDWYQGFPCRPDYSHGCSK